MALVVITVSDDQQGGVAVSLISEPQMNPSQPLPSITPAQRAALDMIEAMQVQKDEPSRVLLLND
jgi:hypothetical protein